MAGELVVGYDGSECARHALGSAGRLAARLGVGVVTVFAAEPPAALAGGSGEQRRVLEERGEELMTEAGELLGALDVPCVPRVVDDKPIHALLAVADEFDALCIVVGTYSERPISAALVGSTPHKLLHLSERPVMVVPVPDRPESTS